MSDVPEDIKQTAIRIAGNYLAFNVSCDAIYRDVKEALMAEREACAMIAENYEGGLALNGDYIAAAIRRGTPT